MNIVVHGCRPWITIARQGLHRGRSEEYATMEFRFPFPDEYKGLPKSTYTILGRPLDEQYHRIF